MVIKNKKEHHKLYMRKWYKKNPEKLKKIGRDYYNKNKEKCKIKAKKWKSQNPIKAKLIQKNWRKKYRKSVSFIKKKPIWDFAYQNFRKALLEKYNYCCSLCFNKNNLQIHHKKYTNKFEDVTLLCVKCHRKVHKFL